MAGEKESLFTFDPDEFVKGITTMTKAMTTMSSMAEKQMNSLEGATNKGFGDMTKGQKDMVKQQKKVGGQFFKSLVVFEIFKKTIGAGFNFLKGVVGEFLPEVGQVFSVAKNIMFKNLFFPLRKFLLPMLNKFLAWVTKSRGLFVKWGGVIVNVFKVVIAVFKGFWTIAKAVIKGFTSTFGKMFSGMGKDLTEVVNLMLFKITTGVIALEQILKPVAEFIGKIFGVIATAVKEFVKGYVDGFMEMFNGTEEFMGIGENLKGLWTELIELVGELGISLDGVGGIFRKIGKIIGTLVGTQINLLVTGLKEVIKTVKNLVRLMKGDIGFKDLGASLSASGTGLFDVAKGGAISLFDTVTGRKDKEKVNDALITKDGKVIEFNPNDNILATQGQGGGGMGNNISISIPVQVFTSPEDAFATGQNVGDGILSKIRDSLVGEIVLSGS